MQVNLGETAMVDRLIDIELSLISAYEHILAKTGDSEKGAGLRAMLHEHREAAQLLDGRLCGELPFSDRAASGCEPTSSFETLRRKEAEALQHYQEALLEDELNPGLKSLISTLLLPDTESRLPRLATF